eukprot:TRINITY_DN37881_c0_g1_i1.p1 TRINITY_DN37881_c0_g1~~TRINITY_DN37881_c0_g1_i1.p1  ORF type:complete len:250 (-),score=44.04 TRINITY_DN37881_c0_g1_i1:239-940(-)
MPRGAMSLREWEDHGDSNRQVGWQDLCENARGRVPEAAAAPRPGQLDTHHAALLGTRRRLDLHSQWTSRWSLSAAWGWRLSYVPASARGDGSRAEAGQYAPSSLAESSGDTLRSRSATPRIHRRSGAEAHQQLRRRQPGSKVSGLGGRGIGAAYLAEGRGRDNALTPTPADAALAPLEPAMTQAPAGSKTGGRERQAQLLEEMAQARTPRSQLKALKGADRPPWLVSDHAFLK